MTQYTKVGEIALWPNKAKTGKQPDVTGTIKLESGQKLSVSLWKNDRSENPDRPVYSGSVDKKEGASPMPNSPAPTQEEFDSEIPF